MYASPCQRSPQIGAVDETKAHRRHRERERASAADLPADAPSAKCLVLYVCACGACVPSACVAFAFAFALGCVRVQTVYTECVVFRMYIGPPYINTGRL